MQQEDVSAPPPGESPAPTPSEGDRVRRRGIRLDEVLLAALLVLSLAGVAVSDFSAASGLAYWMWIVPIFAGASVYAGWNRARREEQGIARHLVLQLLHWAPLLAVFYVIFLLERTGRLNREDAGLVALLALALTTFLAGVHFDRRILAVGLLLGVATVCAALVEEFFWILLLPTVIAAIAYVVWRRRTGRSDGNGA